MDFHHIPWLTDTSIFLFSTIIPLSILWGRSNVKTRRQQILLDLQQTFKLPSEYKSDDREPIIPSFEFVKYKYDMTNDRGSDDAPWTWFVVPVGIFILLCFLGFHLSFLSSKGLLPLARIITGMGASVTFRFAETRLQALIDGEHVLAAATYTFLGSYLFSLTFLIRSISNFDLSPLSFIRVAAHIIFAWFVSITLFIIVPDPGVLFSSGSDFYANAISNTSGPSKNLGSDLPPMDLAKNSQGATVNKDQVQISASVINRCQARLTPFSEPENPAEALIKDVQAVKENSPECLGLIMSRAHSSSLFVGLAFLIGFFPTLGIDTLLSRFPTLQLKRVDEDAYKASRIVPLDVIDGIDSYTKFRLQIFQIEDVQNLATANPIMLFVETPFGVYEIIDWVAQAQLITAVGVRKANELRKLNIRTIFDLGKCRSSGPAMDDCGRPTPNAANRPDMGTDFRRLVAQILVTDVNKTATSEGIIQALDGTIDLLESGLHVRRLRQIWGRICDRLSIHPAWNQSMK